MSRTHREIVPFVGPIDADVVVPGSKSITNRVLLLAALAKGQSRISGVLVADDTTAMLAAVEALGSRVEADDGTDVTIVPATGAVRASGEVIDGAVHVDARQSGTTSRFLLPVLAGTEGTWLLDGHEQLRGRPFDDQIDALRGLGAEITEVGEPGRLPLLIAGRRLDGGLVEIRGDASSQFVSGLLLAGPAMTAPLRIRVTTELVSRPYVDLTIAAMAEFGANVSVDGDEFVVEPGAYVGGDIAVEPDASAASYFFGAAAVAGGRVRVMGLGSHSRQGDLGFVDVLSKMGASVEQTEEWTQVTVTGPLRGVTTDMSQISDTAQTLAAVAAVADGTTEATGIGFIQAKETRRLDAIVAELTRLGVVCELTDDGFVMTGRADTRGQSPSDVAPCIIETYDDHRMAMSFALVGLARPGVSIAGPECVNKTFPDYWDVLESIRPIDHVPLVVAVDGPAGSGKSTVATALAEALDAVHFDTGAMYRAVAFAVLRAGVDLDDDDAIVSVARSADISFGSMGAGSKGAGSKGAGSNGAGSKGVGETVIVDGEDATTAIRSPEVTAIVSRTSAIPAVREVMVDLQRKWAAGQGGAVLDGRDIGTVVFPDAPIKFFLTARAEVRAARRFAETTGQTLEEIAADIERRDHADSSRATSPLRPADDAIMVDTSDRAVTDIVDELARRTRDAWDAVPRPTGDRT